MFKLKQKDKLLVKVKGLLNPGITYESRVTSKNWSAYFGKYENQRWNEWDSNSCWLLSAVNCLEDQLRWLYENGMFGTEALNFFTSYGYIDTDGQFSISERFLEVLGGNGDTGGTAQEAWQLMQSYGCIPRSLLTYSKEQADKFTNKTDFNVDYFSKLNVTKGMMDIGKEFLTHIRIAYQRIGVPWITPQRMVLEAALAQAPLQIGIPVNVNEWNQVNVPAVLSGSPMHEVELYGLDEQGNYLIFDQYLPNLKVLHRDYYVPFVTQGIITAVNPVVVNPTPQPSNYWVEFWTGVNNYYNGLFNSKVPIGNICHI